MLSRRSSAVSSLVLLLAAVGGGIAHAQAGTLGAPVPITLSAQAASNLTITIQSGAVQNIPSLVPGAANQFPTPVQVLTQWNLGPMGPGGGSLSLVAYFTSPATALMSGPNVIPASRVEARVPTGALLAFTPITSTGVGGVGTAGGSAVLWTQLICNNNACRNNQRTDQVELRLNLTGLTPPPGTYSGTLNLRAVTY